MPQSSKSSAHSVHLELEPLEDRCVLSSAAYVTSLYVDLLYRIPAASEVNGWVMAINSWERINLNGVSPAAAAAAFTTSPEYLNDTVRAAYQIYLNRTPAPSETAGWVAALQAGLPETQLQASILASNEFFTANGGNAYPWLNSVYQKSLGRLGAQAELDGWNQALQSGVSRQGVALAIVTSPEADARLVQAAYQAILGRAPEAAGLAGWVSQLEHGLTPSQLIAVIINSPEVIARGGGLDAVPPSRVQPVPTAAPVDTFGEPFLPPLTTSPIAGCYCTATNFTLGSGNIASTGGTYHTS
jgi:Domain of unknown function (DUF4214)